MKARHPGPGRCASVSGGRNELSPCCFSGAEAALRLQRTAEQCSDGAWQAPEIERAERMTCIQLLTFVPFKPSCAVSRVGTTDSSHMISSARPTMGIRTHVQKHTLMLFKVHLRACSTDSTGHNSGASTHRGHAKAAECRDSAS